MGRKTQKKRKEQINKIDNETCQQIENILMDYVTRQYVLDSKHPSRILDGIQVILSLATFRVDEYIINLGILERNNQNG